MSWSNLSHGLLFQPLRKSLRFKRSPLSFDLNLCLITSHYFKARHKHINSNDANDYTVFIQLTGFACFHCNTFMPSTTSAFIPLLLLLLILLYAIFLPFFEVKVNKCSFTNIVHWSRASKEETKSSHNWSALSQNVVFVCEFHT